MATADTLPTRLQEAVTALNNGDMARALTAASSAMAIAPENPDCHLILASVYHNKGDEAQAEHHYIETLRLNPKQPRALINLGMLKLNGGNTQAAISSLKTALDIDAGSHEARHLLARAYGMAGKFSLSAQEFKRLLNTSGKNVEIIQGYAKALTGLKQFDDALKALKRADALNPGHPAITNEIAQVRAAMGQEKLS